MRAREPTCKDKNILENMWKEIPPYIVLKSWPETLIKIRRLESEELNDDGEN